MTEMSTHSDSVHKATHIPIASNTAKSLDSRNYSCATISQSFAMRR